jgi:hypothetical protein
MEMGCDSDFLLTAKLRVVEMRAIKEIKQPKIKDTHSGHTLKHPFECQHKY